MTTTTLPRIGAAATAGIAAVHLVLAPEYFDAQAYIGVLFLLGAAAAGVIAARLWRASDRATWALGAALSDSAIRAAAEGPSRA